MKENRGSFTRILAVVGNILVWIPILAPLLFSGIFLIQTGMFRFDYLMPAELSLFALLGGASLLWTALRARALRGPIGWGFGIAIAMLVCLTVIPTVTGLASGDVEPGGWQWALALTMLVIFSLALVALGIGGVLLLRDVFKKPGLPQSV